MNRIAYTRFDVLIDLSLRPTTLGPYLCRITRSPLRICLGMDEVQNFYNLHYNGMTPAGLYLFLKKIMDS
ncbi:MAG TPA: hypothetical protein ENN17_07935 [bacterium]|nr:hypothetical protein [bacterium]